MLRVSDASGSFRGIGSSRCTGKFKLPFALGLRPDGVLNGESSELENDEVLCLLSLQDQTQLGLCKDLRSGRVTLTDFPNVWLPVARHVRTGLLLLNVSSFGKDPNRHHRAFALRPRSPCKRLKEEMTPKAGMQEESTHLVGDLSAYMTGGEAEASSQKCKKVHFFSFGLEKLEFAKKSHKKSKRLTELFQTFSQRGKSYDFTLDSEEHERALLGSLRENFPFVANLDESQILFVDCRATGDPASDKSMRDHLGIYPPTMKHMTTNPEWVDWWKEVVPSAHRLMTEVEEAYVFVFCKSGRHRSVANADLMSRAIFDLYDVEGVELDHLCDGSNWKHTCAGKCEDCKWENPQTRPMAEQAVTLVRQIWKEVVLETGDVLPEPGGSAAADKKEKEKAAREAEPARGSKDKPGDSLGSTERPEGDPSEGTSQSVDVDKKISVLGSSRLHDGDVRRPAQEGSVSVSQQDLYSVFDPQKQGKVPELIAKYELDLAQSLFENLRDSVMGGKRTELGWETTGPWTWPWPTWRPTTRRT